MTAQPIPPPRRWALLAFALAIAWGCLAPGRAEAVRGWAGGIGATVDLRWESFAQYLDALRSVRPSINVVHFVGHGALRLATVGPDWRREEPVTRPSPTEPRCPRGYPEGRAPDRPPGRL